MIRTREMINDHRKMIKERLEEEIEQGIAFEKQNDKRISQLNDELDFVSKEVCYEDTLKGRITEMEEKTFKVIKPFLKQLTEITGKNYHIEEDSL